MKSKKAKPPITCPICGDRFRRGKPMLHHLHDKHHVFGMRAHLIANPDDIKAKKTKAGRRAISAPKRIIGTTTHDDFDLIDMEDSFS